ncbi:MAG: hypothetical protein K0S19_79 [Geminicoccaceae bacterium]|jgi:hypothetical protein|nr:hypothetical protein [Geminicoccaceae bacterium]
MRRWWIWGAGAVALVAVAAVVASFFVDEPLRRSLERQLNARLQGYTVRIGALDFHPFGFSIDLEDVSLTQDAHPDPPVARVPELSASVQWRALLRARVVADVQIERLALHLNLTHLVHEARDEVPVQARGWQEAVQAVSPLHINEVQIVEGEVTYVDQDASRPMRLRQLNVRAGNIRNVKSAAGVYPSDLHVDGVIVDSGTFKLEGQADFLAVPHVAVKAQVALEQIALAPFQPVARRYNLDLRRGTLSAAGDLEYAPTIRIVHLRQLTIDRLQADYIHMAQTAVVEKQRVQQVKQTAQEVSNAPGMLLRADQVRLTHSTLGFVNRAARPDYRLFLDGAEVDVQNFSNQLTEGTAGAKITGKFMGSGQTVVGANFRPETKGPDFALAAAIENTQLPALNPLLRAYGKLDVVGGFFSVYTEMRVKNRAVQGYVKPLIRDMDVYDARQDQEKNLFQQLYEALAGGVSEILENFPRDEVATQANIAGPLENPQASTWQVVVTLIQNAFFQAILPGFEGERGRGDRGPSQRSARPGAR